MISKLKDLKVKVPEALQVGVIITKFSLSYNDYRKKLFHTIEEFFLWTYSKTLTNWRGN